MEEHTGACVGGPADGETYSTILYRMTYVTKVDGAFEHSTYMWDDTSKTWRYEP